jgi:hypothetical protein
MDKMKIQEIADQVADDMGYDFGDLSPKMQIKVYNIAMDQYQDMLADAADMARKNEASGGMMRTNYARGSEDDIPEQEDMPMEEFDDIKKMLGVPMDQASGIKSLKNKTASMDENEEVFMRLVDDFMERGFSLQEAIEAAKEEFENRSSKRNAPSIKMAEGYGDYDPLIVEEYEKYKYDAEEQGVPVMSIDDFLQMARAGAMNGGIMRNMYEGGGGAKQQDKKQYAPPWEGAKQQDKKQYAPPWEYGPNDDVLPQKYSDPVTARIESEKKDRAVLKDIQRGEYPLKKTGKNIDLDVEKIKKLIDQRKKDQKKLAKGGIAGVL